MENNHAWVLLGRKMTGEATPEELAELDRLLRDDPGVLYSLEVITGLWKECREKMDAAEIEEYYQRHFERLMAVDPAVSLPVAEKEPEFVPEYPGFEESRRKSRRVLSMAAILLGVLITGAGLYWLPGRKPQQQKMARLNEVSTKNGSKSKVVLPDGTQVWLNSGSKLAYANDLTNEATREVTLSGEAFFEVVHDEQHPFIIHTQSFDIKDIGTAFNVKAYPGEITTEATLVKGSIEISFRRDPLEKIILKPNQKITLFNNQLKEDTLSSVKTVRLNNQSNDIFRISKVMPDTKERLIPDTAWMANKLIFQSEPFPVLAAQLERWYNVKIKFGDSKVEGYKFTGVFENETISQALEALRITGSFRYKISDDTVLIWK